MAASSSSTAAAAAAATAAAAAAAAAGVAGGECVAQYWYQPVLASLASTPTRLPLLVLELDCQDQYTVH